ncbi:ATP-binding cassette domain-containing protein [Salsipaludibacter albus]|uniref:ATP-binding cassette domain-containing protein n=1 Tax=Salsipaludibacter albus TaxID=2849650 RepID=UPI001EE3F42D|nr:ATP-binding cassette domain-containing protein [Salsipaludibacter albus]MBY5162808.1 ATP-binding cassette domain-containing protein [Salsipaludibacter albus]
MTAPAVEAHGLVKRFGETTALDGFDLEVPTGTVLGLLGPNGAGKTTAVHILTTLSRADEGTARVAGFDVATEGARIRSRIGLTGQFAAIDEHLTGRENLVMVAQLSGLPRDVARGRADDLLDRFGLSDAGGRAARGYSGGMRRRLDLAASLVTSPEVVFLDEPTTGLDPSSRFALWEVIREVVALGTSVLLTTQYLEEADELADDILVMNHGRGIAQGTAAELKDRVGGETIVVELSDPTALDRASDALRDIAGGELHTDPRNGRLSFPAKGDRARLAATVRALDDADLDLVDLGLRRPSLDDVFLELTGERAVADEAADDVAQPTGGRR